MVNHDQRYIDDSVGIRVISFTFGFICTEKPFYKEVIRLFQETLKWGSAEKRSETFYIHTIVIYCLCFCSEQMRVEPMDNQYQFPERVRQQVLQFICWSSTNISFTKQNPRDASFGIHYTFFNGVRDRVIPFSFKGGNSNLTKVTFWILLYQ